LVCHCAVNVNVAPFVVVALFRLALDAYVALAHVAPDDAVHAQPVNSLPFMVYGFAGAVQFVPSYVHVWVDGFVPVPPPFAYLIVNVLATHCAYNVIVVPSVAVRFSTLCPFVYAVPEPFAAVFHPLKCHPVNEYPFVVNALGVPYEWLLVAVVPEIEPLAPAGLLELYATLYVIGEHVAFAVPPLVRFLYPVLHDVVYVHWLFDTDTEQLTPVLPAHAGQEPHTAYNSTVAPFVVVRFATALSAYATVEDPDEVAQPWNVLVPYVNVFAVKATPSSYVRD
jgi:hypothetical protein